MIYASGSQQPSNEQLAYARKWADESFCTTVETEFMVQVPTYKNMVPAQQAIVLKLKSVEPHDDTWQGKINEAGEDGPPTRYAFFWLMKSAKPIHLMCGTHSRRLMPNDWVVFDDSVLHCVVADSVWYGSAWQIQEPDYA